MRDGAEILHVSCLLFVQTLSLVGRKLLAKKVDTISVHEWKYIQWKEPRRPSQKKRARPFKDKRRCPPPIDQ